MDAGDSRPAGEARLHVAATIAAHTLILETDSRPTTASSHSSISCRRAASNSDVVRLVPGDARSRADGDGAGAAVRLRLAVPWVSRLDGPDMARDRRTGHGGPAHAGCAAGKGLHHRRASSTSPRARSSPSSLTYGRSHRAASGIHRPDRVTRQHRGVLGRMGVACRMRW